MFRFRYILETFFLNLSINAEWAERLSQIALLAAVLLLSLFATYLCRHFVTPLILHAVIHTRNKWDDYLVNRSVLIALCNLLPGILVYEFLPFCFDNHTSTLFLVLYRLARACIALNVMMLVAAFLKNITTVTTKELEEHHLVGILQFLRLLTYCLGGIVMASLLLGNNPLRVIAGLGAAATVLMLIFKDSILGLVAGIQLSMNKMLKVGDWVTIKKLDIDGTVEEVSLTTVKVRNFDNTISTVPPYTLVSDSFQNWDAMFVRGRRRAKRALYIDVLSIHFTSEEERDSLKRKKLISKMDAECLQITNLTLYRHYITETLKADKLIANEQFVLARQLAPTPNGLPLEIWFYTTETSFVRYEEITSSYMERFIAMLPAFGLRHYQAPTGHDFATLQKQST